MVLDQVLSCGGCISISSNPLNRSVANGLACQKIESWDQSNWDFLAKEAPYLDSSDEHISGHYDLLVIDLDKYLMELDIISGGGSDFERIENAMREEEELGYIPSHINSWDISPKFRYSDKIKGDIYYSSKDEAKISDQRSRKLFDSIFGFNPVDKLEKISEEECSNL